MAQQRSVADLEKQLKALEATIAKQAVATDAQVAAQKRITKELEKQKSLQEEALSTNKEIDDTLQSIASSFGKQSRIYKRTEAQLNLIEKTIQNSLNLTNEWKNASSKNKQLLETQAKKYKNINAQSLKNISLLGQGKAEQHEIIDALQDQIDLHEEALKSIDAKAKHSKKFKEEIQGEIDAMKKLQSATKSAAKDVEAINRMGSAFGGTMLGGGIDKTLKAFGKKDGLGGVIKGITDSRTAASGGGGVGSMFSKMLGGVSRFLGPIALAVGGIMAAAEYFDSGGAAKMAMRMAVLNGENPMDNKRVDTSIKQSKQYRDLVVEKNYKTPLKLQQQAENDYLGYKQSVEEDSAKYKESLITDEFEYRMSLETDAIQFRQQQASAELDANLSRQKTLFTSGMGYMKQSIGISERALMAIGSSTAAVLDTVKEYGYTLGVALKDQIALSAAAQGLAVRYGSSATDVFKMADTFRLMNKTSAKTGANLVAGLEDLAKSNDMSPAQLYKEMADAQADILKYSSYTTEEYARQAIQLGNMNTSMANMLKASDSMVLNYKDSIKAEMSLSAMLGKNVNFSEVRAKLMSGDQAGGAAALKTALGGQDINAMNPFAKQALSQATGMGIQELMQLTQSKGGDVKGTLEERNARKTGAAIAKGALQQDIANAAAKLALDQKNRAEMLKFEQAKRMAMLFIEQKFRLNAIEREITYRQEREELGYTQAQKNLKMGFMTDVASEQFMQVTSAFKEAEANGKISKEKLNSLISEFTVTQDVLQKAMAKNFITNDELPDIAYQIAMDANKGKSTDITQFAGVQRFLAASEKSNAQQNAYNEKRIAAFQNFGKVMLEARNTGDTDKLEELVEVMKHDYPKMYKEFESQRNDGMKGGKAYNPENFIKYLRKINVVPATAKPTIAPTINKPTPVTVVDKKTGSNVDSKPAPVPLPPDAPKLSDSQAQVKLQVQMVKLLGVSAQFLGQIDANTLNGMTATIDGKPLAKKLLDQANRTYGVAGASF